MGNRAVILAGGRGTRLLPYTALIPKPLMPLGGRYCILEIVIMQLVKAGFNHITLAVNHLSQLFTAYFGDGSRYDANIDYSLEQADLSTIGPLTLLSDLPQNTLVMNGDILCDLDYRVFYETHCRSGAKISVSSFRRTVNIDFGVLEYNDNHHLQNFSEKPEFKFDVSMGIYCLNKSVIEALAPSQRYGFDQLMKDSLAMGRPVNIQPFKGYWLDIGRPEDYERANADFEKLASKLGIR